MNVYTSLISLADKIETGSIDTLSKVLEEIDRIIEEQATLKQINSEGVATISIKDIKMDQYTHKKSVELIINQNHTPTVHE